MKEGKDKEGLPNCSKALKIYEQLQVNNFDMAVILSRMAEISNGLNNNSDAIKYELRSLNIISNLYGKHSKDYIDEAYYLKKYYDANGDKDKAEKLDTQLETLQKELDDGEVDLPEAVEFTSAAVAHSHNNDMQRCINYLFNHYVNAPKMDDAANYIFMWSVVSGDCNIIIGDDFSKLLFKPETKIYMFAYIAALSEYALATGKKDFSLDAYSYMMSKLCNYYSVNKEYTGEVKLFEKYISAYNKGKGKYEELVKKDFEKNSKHK